MTQNKDELNKQFFALLVLKRFIPIYGGAAGGENVVLGLAETQINSILGGMSEKYQLEAGLSDGQTNFRGLIRRLMIEPQFQPVLAS